MVFIQGCKTICNVLKGALGCLVWRQKLIIKKPISTNVMIFGQACKNIL